LTRLRVVMAGAAQLSMIVLLEQEKAFEV